LGGGIGELDDRKDDGVDGRKDSNAEETSYKKREKNQTKTTREQGEHRAKRGGGGRRKGKAFPSSLAKPHKAARRAPLRRLLKRTLGFFRASLSKQERSCSIVNSKTTY
jgi:hypothetical protein